MHPPDEHDIENMLANPYYAITFADYVFETRTPEIAKEDWVATNTKLIEARGATAWLKNLITCLSIQQRADEPYVNATPLNVVTISNNLKGKHEALIPVELWMAANEKLLKEVGTEKWLWRLLETLESGEPSS